MEIFVLCDEKGEAILFGGEDEMEGIADGIPGANVKPTRVSFSLTEKVIGFNHIQPGVLVPVN